MEYKLLALRASYSNNRNNAAHDSLTEEVMKYLSDGWKPFGSPYSCAQHGELYQCQAVIRDEEFG